MAEYQAESTAPQPGAPTAQSRYRSLEQLREPFLLRARDAAKVTIPALMPPAGSNGSTILPQPFQSMGAKGVLNLAAKLMLALFPPGAAFFRFQLEPKLKQQLKQQSKDGQDLLAEAEAALSTNEQLLLERFEQAGGRVSLASNFEQMLVAGNGLIYIQPDGGILAYRLDRYVVKRDGEKNPLEIILKECFSRASLEPMVRAIVEQHGAQSPQARTNNAYQDEIEVFTRIQRRKGIWYEFQEVCGIEIPDTRSTYPLDASPWLPVAINLIPGEDYGRGFVEAYMGDLLSLESLRQSIVEFGAQAAKIVWLVNPSGSTDAEEFAKAPSGKVMEGKDDDVKAKAMEKFADFKVVESVAASIERSLGECFLLGSAARRDAERVTAEEIRLIAGELEQSLGSIYSVMTTDLQLPMVKRYSIMMQRKGELSVLPKDLVKPKIVTGLAALGRNADAQKLDALVAGLQQNFGPEATAEYINVGGYAKRKATAYGIDVEGVVRSEDEVNARREQQQKMDLATKLGPNMIDAQSNQRLQAQAQAAPAQASQ